ncbi:hypothetical protein K1719_012879 [Acacia pycnantha]|nr:hypothetical protein K1719_012879 [Acacia pycnantha]
MANMSKRPLVSLCLAAADRHLSYFLCLLRLLCSSSSFSLVAFASCASRAPAAELLALCYPSFSFRASSFLVQIQLRNWNNAVRMMLHSRTILAYNTRPFMGTTYLARHMGTAIKDLNWNKKVQGLWYSPHMAAASRAISERIPMVDLIVEVRDARIPLSSEYEILSKYPTSSRHIIVLNKMDLADRSKLQEWVKYFRERDFISYGVNCHNKDNIKKFLSLIQSQVRQLKKTDHTATAMLVGIPNVGKSALANSLHQIGRISAAEKGKLKHATVSPEPGETRDIRSFKIASHPNIYVLDTPGVLPPEIPDVDACSRLILTGAIKDSLIGTKELAQCFLAILNSSGQYNNWANLSIKDNNRLSLDCTMEFLNSSALCMKQRRQSPTDHTQDCIVHNVRRTLFETISAYEGNTNSEVEMENLISLQFKALQKAFQVSAECPEEANVKVGKKLLDLFHTGRLGHYTLDPLRGNPHCTFALDDLYAKCGLVQNARHVPFST